MYHDLLNDLRHAWTMARAAGNEEAMADIEREAFNVKVWDTDTKVKGKHTCSRCAGTGAFITMVENGKPKGPGGICFRCGGKGYHTLADRRRNDYHDTHRVVHI